MAKKKNAIELQGDAPPEVKETIMAVLVKMERKKVSGRPHTLIGACKTAGISVEYLNECVRKYDDLNKEAARIGLIIGGVPIKRVVSTGTVIAGASLIPELKPALEGIIPYTPQRETALLNMVECLEQGMPFPAALRYAGVTKHQLSYWLKDEPDLVKTLQRAEAKWAKGFFSLFNKALQRAADNGKVDAFVEIASKRFINSWADMADIDALSALRAKDDIAAVDEDGNKRKTGPTIIIEAEEVEQHGDEV